jgi:predicted lactoylglutathione lyase
MATKIFVNLPVNDLNKSMEFFTKIGYTFNKQFTDETAACMVVSEDIYVMLLTRAKFSEFTNKEISDAKGTTEVIIALSADSKEEVTALADKAIEAGAIPTIDELDYGFMYSRSFQDLDGHQWEVVWMDPSAVQPGE